MLEKIKEKKSSIVLVVVVMLLLIAAGLFFKLNGLNKANIYGKNSDITMDSDYIIPNVPYYGIHNNLKGHFGNTVNSAFSIATYWNPGLIESLETGGKVIDIKNINDAEAVFVKAGFVVQTLKLSLTDLKKYINPEVRTPLLLFLPLDAKQPDEVMDYAATVLIGINEKEQKLTFHDFWLGNNYEMSYDKFNQLENRLPVEQRNSYTLIQPNNLDEKLKEISQRKIVAYPARTEVMRNGESMLRNYGIGVMAYNLKAYGVARAYLLKVEGDANFNEFSPPFLRVMDAYLIGRTYYADGDLDNALAYAQKSVAVDHDLDQPFKDWPGMKIDWRVGAPGRVSGSYDLLGDVYRQRKDFQKAKDNYLEALKIAPADEDAKNGLRVASAYLGK